MQYNTLLVNMTQILIPRYTIITYLVAPKNSPGIEKNYFYNAPI